MVGPELQVTLSCSLVLGVSIGALLCTYLRAGRQRLVPNEGAFQAYMALRQELASLQESLQHDAPIEQAAAPITSSPSWSAEEDDDPPIFSKLTINEGAWRRLPNSPLAPRQMPLSAQTGTAGMVAPARRRPHAVGQTGSIDARMAEELVWRHFGVAVDPLRRPANEMPGKVLRMPPAQVHAPSVQEPQSLAR